jgi:hypothetical protein
MSPSDLGVFVFTAVALVAEHDDARLAKIERFFWRDFSGEIFQ